MRDRVKKRKNYLRKKQEEGILKLAHKKSKKHNIDNDINDKLEDIVKDNKDHLLSLLKRKKFYLEFGRKKKEDIVIPKKFCMSTNPNDVIYCIKHIFTGIINNKVEEVHFDHTECEEIDLAASAVMDAIILSTTSDNDNISICYSGIYSPDSKISSFLQYSGILKHLDLCDKENPESIEKDQPIEYELKLCDHNTDSSKLTTELTEFYDECLKTQGYKLNQKGNKEFYKIIGEVIANCKDHGDKLGKWYVQGHYVLDSENIGNFYLTIFNFGYSIYEVLKRSATEDTKYELEEITNIHKHKFNDKWNKEMLWTLYSLQEGVSRLKDTTPENYSRGTGTMTFIESFYLLGHSLNGRKPIMSITSGNTHIIFNDKYKVSEINNRKVIAFNSTNDLHSPPDCNNVIKLNHYFPGTVININMPLDRNYLSKFKRGD